MAGILFAAEDGLAAFVDATLRLPSALDTLLMMLLLAFICDSCISSSSHDHLPLSRTPKLTKLEY